MKRLTDNVYHTREEKERAIYIGESRLQAIYDKLFDLEDIEEELGIDLIILLKAVKDGVWCKFLLNLDNYSVIYRPFEISYWKDCETNEQGMYICGMMFENYGKTWALTKEELL